MTVMLHCKVWVLLSHFKFWAYMYVHIYIRMYICKGNIQQALKAPRKSRGIARC
jgi:hypothetical protein